MKGEVWFWLIGGVLFVSLLLREGQLPVDRVCDVMGQLADALMEAHALGYVHRDLRPRSIFLTRCAPCLLVRPEGRICGVDALLA